MRELMHILRSLRTWAPGQDLLPPVSRRILDYGKTLLSAHGYNGSYVCGN